MEYHQTLAAGTILNGEYRVIRLLGSGGFGNTYLALDTTLEREVAVKEYFPSELVYRSGPEIARLKTAAFEDNFKWGRDRFVQEGRTLAKFRHPNIVRVFRTFDANETSYMVLEFVKGADMEVWLKGLQHRPTQDELDKLVVPILEALDLVHSSGILHRDIKPANIYIREEDHSPVLLDFGAARYSVGELTGTTAAIVSRGYSPHEGYASDAKLQGPWTDLYGVAATLYRALSGDAPPEAAGRVLDDNMVPTAEVVADASLYRPEFLEAVDWGLQVLPRNRPQSVAEWRGLLLPGGAARADAGSTSQPRSVGAPVSRPSGARGPDSKPSRPSVGRPSLQRGATRPSPTVLAPDVRLPSTVPIGAAAGAAVAFCGLTVAALWLTGVMPNPFSGSSGTDTTSVAVHGTKDAGTGDKGADARAIDRVAKEREEAERKAAEERERVAYLAKQEEERAKAEEERQRAAAAAKADDDRKRKGDAERKAAEEKQRLAMLAKQAEEERRRQDEARKAEEERQRQAALAKAEEEKKRKAEEERQRQAAIAEEKKRKEDERKAEEERQRQAALAKAEEERKRKEEARKAEEERQRQAALAKAEEERKRKEDERRAEEERQRQAALAKAEEERKRKEDERRAEEERQQQAALARVEAERKEREAEEARRKALPSATDKPNEQVLAALVKKIQAGLKDRRCYDGDVNGEASAADAALKNFNEQLESKGRTARPIQLASATIEDFETWMQWFNGIDDVTCAATASPGQEASPAATDRPSEEVLAELVKKIQTGLKDRRCYDGEVNGDASDADAALEKFNDQLERKGKDVKTIRLASATIENFENWMQWFNGVDGVTCPVPKSKGDDGDRATKKKPRTREDKPVARKDYTPSKPSPASKTKSSGPSVNDLLKGTR